MEEARQQNRPSPTRKKIPLALTTKVTKRKIGRILSAVQTAVFRVLKQKSDLTTDELQSALDSPEVRGVVQKHMLSENIGLVDATGRPLYRRESLLIG